MSKTIWAVVRSGRIELLEDMDLPEGARVQVTLFPENDAQFWQEASQTALDSIWENSQDDVYARLLQK